MKGSKNEDVVRSIERRSAKCHDKYVVVYSYKEVDKKVAVEEVTLLLYELQSVGLLTEVRPGYDQSLLIFVKAPRELLGNTVYKSRVKDWLYGMTREHPGGTRDSVVDGAYEAEDILAVYHLVNLTKVNGGAGVTPEFDQWENVKAIFPLHNGPANQALLKHLSKRFFLTTDDLDKIRNLFGAKVAFYFAFIQTYLVFLFFPAATGLLAWAFLPKYSLLYAIVTCVWCTVFLEYWKIQETDLSIRWDVRGVGQSKHNRAKYRWEKTFVDEAGRTVQYFPRWKLVARQALQIPFGILAVILLGAIIIGVFALEVLISEDYSGSFKRIVAFIPTIMLALALPRISSLLEVVAIALTDFENHRTQDNYEMALTQKIFTLDIITNYLPIFITAFIYIPFGADIVPWLGDFSKNHLGSFGQKFIDDDRSIDVDSGRLRDEVIALTLTGQLSSFFEENIVPVAKRKFSNWYRDYRASHSKKTALRSTENDDPSEAHFLKSVRNQARLDLYNVQDDISEIVLQFGYLALFSPVWPLISIPFLINNIIEIRTDFLKIITEQQRPAPVRGEGIGAWISALDFLTWAGSITTGAIVHLFGANSIAGGAWWALPITIFISEHVFVAMRSAVRFILHRIGSEQIRKERHERYALRVNYMQKLEDAGIEMPATERRERRKSIRLEDGDGFFLKQIEEGASLEAGVALIKMYKTDDESHDKMD